MHVQNNAGNIGPLSERFTLVLITHNRPAFLQRALQYYSRYPCTVLVLDSTPVANAAAIAQFPNVDYRHLPQFSYTGLQDKVTYGVEQVTTPFMVFAADDDFLLHDAMTQSVEFLERNPDYGLCHGYGMMYLARATEVSYFRRDRRVCEDYASELGEERVMEFMSQFLPPFYAVTRTDLLQQWYRALPPGTSFEWQEIGHTYYLLACAKARILPIPFAVREANYGGSEHNTNVLTVLTYKDPKTNADRQQFAEFLASLPTAISGKSPQQLKQLALDSFTAMAECLLSGRSLAGKMIVRSVWKSPASEPVRLFGETQFVEMPFYNQPMFDLLTEFEFLIHSMPAGRLQLKELEGVLLKQQALMHVHANDTDRSLKARLWEALDCNVFNREVVQRLIELLTAESEQADLSMLRAWAARLETVPVYNGDALLANMPSGRLLDWLKARSPDEAALKQLRRRLADERGGPQFGVLLLDLDADMFKLQATLDSLVAGHCKNFKLVVFTTGDLPASTSPKDTLHFVKVSAGNFVEKLNLYIQQSTSDWMVLARAGDQFTPGGLFRAGLELIGAQGCRAVVLDEIHRNADGTLTEIFRPGINLDLLQAAPSKMAGHWLIRRDVLLDADGFSSEMSEALDFDLVLRLIERGGLGGLAHLAEPLVICDANELVENAHERSALSRHLVARGYEAQVESLHPGLYRIDYRHSARPLVSIVMHGNYDFAKWQACLISILQRTRYQHYEVLIADNASDDQDFKEWLHNLEGKGDRIRALRPREAMSPAELSNWAAQEARGDYLVLLDACAEVVNANWMESLLNQAQRPEVGIVGARLVDDKGATTQGGLILGGADGVRAAFVGEPKAASGYMQRLLVEQNHSAVSSICLMIRTALYVQVGGLDDSYQDSTVGDVDLCLKAAEAGFMTVWTPQVQILHPGVPAIGAVGRQVLEEKWSGTMSSDPFYNPNHSQERKPFTLGAQVAFDWSTLAS
ncbi:TIGR00180 family glycosyltransferase [Pseudomonas sp. PB3P13]